MLVSQAIVSNSNCIDPQKDVYDQYSPEYKRLKKVGQKVLNAAKSYCGAKKDMVLKSLKEREISLAKLEILGIHRTLEQTDHMKKLAEEIKNFEEELYVWDDHLHRVEGKWEYILIKDKTIANAFVTATCPRRMFVIEGLFTIFSPTDDELGLVLSHEISHVILGHADSQTINSALISMAQLILIDFIDPTGMFSFFLEFMTFASSKWMNASYSRACENEADAMGLTIASIACFDIKQGVEFFHKLAAKEGHHTTRWFHTHPSSKDRFSSLQNALQEKRFQDADSACARMKKDFLLTAKASMRDDIEKILDILGLST